MYYYLTLSSTFYNSSHYWERLSSYSIYLSDLDCCRCWYALYSFEPISLRSLLPIELTLFLLGPLHYTRECLQVSIDITASCISSYNGHLSYSKLALALVLPQVPFEHMNSH